MKGLKQFAKEMSAIGRNPKLLIPVIGILMIPIMYSGTFLEAFWDPYGHMDRLPVAVVNSDRGAVYEGRTLHIGQDFVEQLRANQTFNYRFVDHSEAEAGLKANRYYMSIEIPESFSEHAATLTSDQPSPAEIWFKPNESSNFLASQIGSNAVEKMKTELGREVTKAYTRTMLEQIHTLSDGLGEASEGASEIAQGTSSAKDGAARIEHNLRQLAEGSVTLKNGVSRLTKGGAELVSGASELKRGGRSLAEGLSKLAEAGKPLVAGAMDAKQGSSDLTAGLKQSVEGAERLSTGAYTVAVGLKQYAQAHPELEADESWQQLLAASQQLAAGADEAKKGQSKLADGAARLSEGTARLSDGLRQFDSQVNIAAAGAASAAAGADRLYGGALRLQEGLTGLSGGVERLADGSAQLDQGARQITDGLIKLTNGTGELSGKLEEAAASTGGIGGDERLVDMFSNPVQLHVEKTSDVPNYGTGFAPYFISLGLFVGALLLTVVYTVKEPLHEPAGAWSWFVGKLLTMAAIGLGQAVIADVILLYGVGLEVESVPLFFLFSVVTGITFLAIIQFLVASMKNPGRFLAIILLIFQLTSSGGTFPLEMIPGGLQKVSEWLPMTHAIAGFRAVISNGDYAVLQHNVGLLLLYFAAFALLSFGYYAIAYRREYRSGDRGDQPQTA